MAFSFKDKKRQKILLIGLGIALIGVIVLYYWQKAPSISTGDSVSGEARLSSSQKRIEKINLDFTFLTDIMLSFLKTHGDLPVEKGETGRENPYIPYWPDLIEDFE